MTAVRAMPGAPGSRRPRPVPGPGRPRGTVLALPPPAALRWPRPVIAREVVIRLASSTPVSGLARVGEAGILAYCLAFPVTDVTVALAGWGSPVGWALLGTAAYTPLYLRQVRYFLRGRPAPHAAWSIAAIAAVIAAVTPLGQAYWVKAYATLAVCLLITVPWRWSLPGLAVLAAVQVPLGAAFGPAASIPFGGIYYPITLLWRTSAVFVPLWLFQALRQLEAARRELAQDAVLEERLRVEDRLRATLGAALAAITARGQRCAALAVADPAAAAAELGELAGLSRRTLADSRRLLSGLRQPSMAAELDKAAALLTAGGIPAHVAAPRTGLPDQPSAAFRAELRAAVARLLSDETAGACVLRVTGTGPEPGLSVDVTLARPAGRGVPGGPKVRAP